MDRGLVEEGEGQFVAPLLRVSKKGTDQYPIPRIDVMLDLLKGYRIFSSLDATDGFWQTLMEMRSRKFTGFVVDGKHYHWVVMPMGLTNAPSTFQRNMDKILGDLIGKSCFVYIDDIIVFGKDEEDHYNNLEKVLARLEEHDLKIKPG